jgi:hypothetical protein
MRCLPWFGVVCIIAVAACGSGLETRTRPPEFSRAVTPPSAGVTPPSGGPTPPAEVPPASTSPVPPAGVTQGPPAAGTVLFAFKAITADTEEIWLWLDGNRFHHVSTWPVEGKFPPSFNTSGFVEGSGRFGLLQFDRQRRFLLTLEKTTDQTNPNAIPPLRLVKYELATGKVTFIPLGVAAAALVASASTTLVVLPAPGSDYSRGNLFELQEGKLIPAQGAPRISFPNDLSVAGRVPLALDVAGDLVFVSERVLRRRQGVWREVAGSDGSFFLDVQAAPAQDALGLIESRYPDRLVWLLTADEAPRLLPCQGRPEHIAFSPDGSLLYVSGCNDPLITRAGKARSASKLSLFGAARVGTGANSTTLGVRGSRSLIAFDWGTLQAAPLPSMGLDSLDQDCRVGNIETPASGSGVSMVEIYCFCIDGDCRYPFGLDLQTQNLLPISAREDSALVGDSVLLGSAMVTAVKAQADQAAIFWTDASGTTKVELPGVKGRIQGAVVP